MTASSTGRSKWVTMSTVVLDRIIAGDYPAESLLPPEAALGAEFGVSRAVVRESIKVLSARGLVVIDRGNGTRVARRDRWNSFDPEIVAGRLRVGDREDVLTQLLALRRMVEPALALRAATLASDAGLAALEVARETLEAALDDDNAYLVADGLFHDSIAAAAGLDLVQDMLRGLAEPLVMAREVTNRIPGGIAHAHAQHNEIYLAVVARDPARAHTAMDHHLRWAQEHLREGL